MSKCNDTYKEVKVMEHPLGIIRVHIPDLTPEERERRMQQIKKAAVDIVVKGKIKNENSQDVKKDTLVV